MENKFYRIMDMNHPRFIESLMEVQEKLYADLKEIESGQVSYEAHLNYVKKTIMDQQPLLSEPEYSGWPIGDSSQMPTDARVDFLYIPTYILVTIMVDFLLKWPEEAQAQEGFMDTLEKGLLTSTLRKFGGHGYEYWEGLLDAFDIFLTTNMEKFLDNYEELCPRFTQSYEEALGHIEYYLEQNNLKNAWGCDYSERGRIVLNKAESYTRENEQSKVKENLLKVFVYGTLMNGHGNHSYYLGDSPFLGYGILRGYALYDLGYYPGIVPKAEDQVSGEIYEIDQETLQRLHGLEGEGSLYEYRQEVIEMGEEIIENVGVYVYLHSVEHATYVPSQEQPWRKSNVH